MANTYSWVINALDTYPTKESLSDVVYNIHWTLVATSDQSNEKGDYYTASYTGEQIISAPSSEDFISFSDLTQDIIEAWLEASNLDISKIKIDLDKEIADKINPASVKRWVPWLKGTIETSNLVK
jgi:predicted nucleotide-binding protein (sugar kinase/HSP70/actin superfamily)